MIFSISDNMEKANKIDETSFSEQNILEKQIQKWVLENPVMLGEDLLIVSSEFSGFSNSKERPDILALDKAGNLVVIELKRDETAGHADLQAIRYAASVSSMTLKELIPEYIDYHKKCYGEDLQEDVAESQIVKFCDDPDSEEFTELSSKPRIILCAAGFSQAITSTVLWLREFAIDIRCVTITPYKVDETFIVVPDVLIPLEEAEQYQISIKQKEDSKQSKRQNHGKETMKILVEKGILKEGDKIILNASLPSYVKDKYKKGDPMFEATITGKIKQKNAVKWVKDGKEYAISQLTHKIFTDCHSEKISPKGRLNGNAYWVIDKDNNDRGKSLYDIAEEHRERTSQPLF